VRESHRDNGCLAVAVELVRDVMGSVRTIGECLKLTDVGDSGGLYLSPLSLSGLRIHAQPRRVSIETGAADDMGLRLGL
jgi:hypothetical protein